LLVTKLKVNITMSMPLFLSIAPFTWPQLGSALLVGLIVGLERQLRGKPVGIRTSTLITLGTYIYTVIGAQITGEAVDTSRIIGQIITGIGFIGAGVMLARDGNVLGVTSAATIWVLAAIGVCIGTDRSGLAIMFAFIVVGVLSGVEILENYFQILTRGAYQRFSGWKCRRKEDNCSENH
jgi:putative Mg2+ transporter-C (MgtC) family protein